MTYQPRWTARYGPWQDDMPPKPGVSCRHCNTATAYASRYWMFGMSRLVHIWSMSPWCTPLPLRPGLDKGMVAAYCIPHRFSRHRAAV